MDVLYCAPYCTVLRSRHAGRLCWLRDIPSYSFLVGHPAKYPGWFVLFRGIGSTVTLYGDEPPHQGALKGHIGVSVLHEDPHMQGCGIVPA
jgi:hypothetical protein